MGAQDITPGPDTGFVNIVLMVDPAWPHKGAWLGQVPENKDKLIFVYCDMADEGLSEEMAVNYATTDVLGRSEDYYTYTGNNNRQLSFTFHFVAQGPTSAPSPGDGSSEGGPFGGAAAGSSEELVHDVRWLEKCKSGFFDPASLLGIAPPPLILTVGELFTGRVLATEVSPKWMGPFEPGSMLPLMAEVRCTFTVVRSILDQDEGSIYGNMGSKDSFNRFLEFPNNGATDALVV